MQTLCSGLCPGTGCLTCLTRLTYLCARGLKRSLEASAAVQQFVRQKTTEVRSAGSSRDTPYRTIVSTSLLSSSSLLLKYPLTPVNGVARAGSSTCCLCGQDHKGHLPRLHREEWDLSQRAGRLTISLVPMYMGMSAETTCPIGNALRQLCPRCLWDNGHRALLLAAHSAKMLGSMLTGSNHLVTAWEAIFLKAA